MTPLLATVFAASLVGSMHCIGMCGPFVAFYSGADGSAGARRLLSHAAYSGGRLLTYVIFGLAAGAIGAVLDVAGSLAGGQRIAASIGPSSMGRTEDWANAQAVRGERTTSADVRS